MSLIKSVCYPESHKFFSKATQWGCKHEKEALGHYEEYACVKHTDLKLEDSGLIIHPDYPHLGASPDSCVSCACCGSGVVEIKCPFSCRDGTLTDAADSGKFCLVRSGETFTLKRDHAYHYQVQLQMLCSRAKYCDYVMWNMKELFVERIYPDAEFIDDAVKSATTLYKAAILPELLGKWFTKTFSSLPVPATPVSGSSSASATSSLPAPPRCICKQQKTGPVVQCASNDCAIKFFHLSCLKLKRKPNRQWNCPACRKKTANV